MSGSSTSSEEPKLRRSSRKVSPVCYLETITRIVGVENVWPQRNATKAGDPRRTKKKEPVRRRVEKNESRRKKRKSATVSVAAEQPEKENPRYQYVPVYQEEREQENMMVDNDAAPKTGYIPHSAFLRLNGQPYSIPVITIKEEVVERPSDSNVTVGIEEENVAPGSFDADVIEIEQEKIPHRPVIMPHKLMNGIKMEPPTNLFPQLVMKHESMNKGQQHQLVPAHEPVHIKEEPRIEHIAPRIPEYRSWTAFKVATWLNETMHCDQHEALFSWIGRAEIGGSHLDGVFNMDCPDGVSHDTFRSFQDCVSQLVRGF